jgi:NAD(P)-dependent dehydrogenase (short-subunit alcohol dehydrogenase family)
MPYGPRTNAMDIIAGQDLVNRTAIVTGAAGGLGLETVRALSAAGASVVAAVRDVDRGKAALKDVRGHVEIEPLNLQDLASVRQFAERWGNRSLNYLINNAGVMNVPFGLTAQGVEMHLGVNHLGHFVLTLLLFQALERGSPSRVVTLSSSAHRMGPLEFDDMNFERRPYDAHIAYAQSKTANALFALGLDRFGARRGVRSFAVMPGVIVTGLMRTMSDVDVDVMKMRMRHALKSTSEGASTVVWAAVAPELSDRGGLYLENCAEAGPGDPNRPGRGVFPHARDPELAAQLWRWSAQFSGDTMGKFFD